MKWFLKVLKQYADFKGRASRVEYWMFVLFNLLTTIAVTAIGYGIMKLTDTAGVFFLPFLYSFAVLMPSSAVTVRRLHDSGKSAWFILVSLIPLVGIIWMFIILITRGDPEDNRYGRYQVITYHAYFSRKRSAAVALIFASVFWALSLAMLFFSQNFVYDNNKTIVLSFLLPVGLLISGILFFSKRIFSICVACSLIILSLMWLLKDIFIIQNTYTELLISFNLPLLFNLLTILIPVALLLSGLYILFKKVDRTVPACLLFVGSLIWLLSIILSVSLSKDPLYNASTFLILLSNTIVIMVPVSMMVFARALLSKDKVVKEVENIMPVSEQADNDADIQFVTPEISCDKQPDAPEPVAVVVINEKQPDAPERVNIQIKNGKILIEPDIAKRKKVEFLREDKDNNNTWVVYKALSKVDAIAFLSKQVVDKPFYYVVVETPEGNFGRDKDGFYQE